MNLVILCISAVTSVMGQDTLNSNLKQKKLFHGLAYGIEWLSPVHFNYGSVERNLSYPHMGHNGFYRFIYKPTLEDNVCFGINCNYREGIYRFRDADYSVSGYFELVKLDVYFTYLKSVGKLKLTSFGGGFFVGGVVSKYTEFYSVNMSKGSTPSSPERIYSGINDIYIGVNVEIQQKIKLSTATYFMFGVKGQTGSPDCNGMYLMLSVNPYIGFII